MLSSAQAAGKSTLFKLLSGTAEPRAGSVTLWGINHSTRSRDERRALAGKVGLLHQDLNLTGQLRVIHNVNAGRLGAWSTARRSDR
ncbi:MAG: ATP-binding cassette domain-containing protein [Acidimicrobiales bacterium]